MSHYQLNQPERLLQTQALGYNTHVIHTHTLAMTSSLDHNTKQRIAKALKQLPYKQSEKDFINTAIDKHLEELYKSRDLKQRV